MTVTDSWAGYLGFAGDRGTMEYRAISVVPNDDGSDCIKSAADSGLVVLRANPREMTLPTVLKEIKPRYTADAMAREVEGAVLLEAVVLQDGRVGPVCVVKTLDPDLDLQAVAAAKAWRFRPAAQNGHPVPVLVTIELTFTLK